ncbi:type II secretion system F family protein [Candidatus Saccharibacteria bacterium]|jgi:type IV pilus assembly protein PilC|nr:type II secretion system F family protein [Candidatus Saccharibacteria bacterium]
MAKFKYVATSSKKKGKTVEGEIDAKSREAVIALLSKQNLQPVSIKIAKPKSSGFFFGKKKVKADELVIFTRQLSAMISAGVPLLRSLNSLSSHAGNPAFKSTLEAVVTDIEGGKSFGDALDRHPDVFSDVYVNMVRAGEAAGILDDILKRLALQQEKSSTVRKKIKSAMTYPAVLVFITVVAFFGLMIFVIPQIGEIIKELGGQDAELPALTMIMLAISSFIINFWYIVFPALAALAYALVHYIRTPRGKSQFHKLILKTPLINVIIKKVAVARFARTYSSLVGAGVSVIESLNVTSRAIGNTVYENALAEASDRVQNGEPLSKVIGENTELFPAILSQMLSVGEETGQTDVVLVKVADFYEEEVDVAIDGINSIIEPVMIVFMGGMVGVIAASVMLPIAGLSQNIKD